MAHQTPGAALPIRASPAERGETGGLYRAVDVDRTAIVSTSFLLRYWTARHDQDVSAAGHSSGRVHYTRDTQSRVNKQNVI